MELLKFFLDLQCDKKFAFITNQISNMACSSGEFAKKKKRCLGVRLDAPFMNLRRADVVFSAQNNYSRSFSEYLEREVHPDL